MKRKPTKQLLVTLCCLLGLCFTMAHADVKPVVKKTYLFVLSAKTALVQKSARGYTLTLQGANPDIMWFTDRPNRQAGYMPTHHFIASWHKSFKNDPPNAGLVFHTYSHHRKSSKAYAVELMHPFQSHHGITFKIKREVKGLPMGTLHNVTLFIDNVVAEPECPECISS